jgi:dTMP kinase
VLKQRGLFVVFEGIDGSGKSTQVTEVKLALEQLGHRCLAEREPSYGIIGSMARDAIKMNREFHPETLALLFAADRIEHIREIIDPALREGYIVICDRFLWSNLAYQGLHMDMDRIRSYNWHTLRTLEPDLTIFIDVPVDVCMNRLRNESGTLELFEQEETLSKVRDNYAYVIRNLGYNMQTIEGNKPKARVTQEIVSAILKHVN